MIKWNKVLSIIIAVLEAIFPFLELDDREDKQ